MLAFKQYGPIIVDCSVLCKSDYFYFFYLKESFAIITQIPYFTLNWLMSRSNLVKRYSGQGLIDKQHSTAYISTINMQSINMDLFTLDQI